MYHQLNLDLKLTIVLLSVYGLYPNGTTWMAVEKHLIYWDCQSYKLDKEKAYSIMRDTGLIETKTFGDGSHKYLITTEGVNFLEKYEIDIVGMRNNIHSAHDLRQTVIDIEHKVYS
jgi:hypothetical protein